MDNDDALAALLTALEDLHNIQNEMHTCIKQARDDSTLYIPVLRVLLTEIYMDGNVRTVLSLYFI